MSPLRRLALLLRHDGGSVAMLVGLAMIRMTLMLGAVLDGGLIFLAHRNARNSADAAALDAAKQISIGADPGDALATNPVSCTDVTVREARPAVGKACNL